MGACETTPPATRRDTHATPDNPAATGPFLSLEDLPPLAGVKLVRPRRCAAAGAPALTPGRAAGRPRAAARKDPEEQLAQPGGARSHRARSVCPLDTGGPYGCRRQGLPCRNGTGTCVRRCMPDGVRHPDGEADRRSRAKGERRERRAGRSSCRRRPGRGSGPETGTSPASSACLAHPRQTAMPENAAAEPTATAQQ